MAYTSFLELLNIVLDEVPKATGQPIKKITAAHDECIYQDGQSSSYFFIIIEGTVKLVYESPKLKQLIIDLYYPGEFFGELEMVGMTTEGRSIIAQTNCTLYQFTKKQFFYMWDHYSNFSRYILQMHCKRLISSGDDKIYSDCMFLKEKVYHTVRNHLNKANYFMYTKDVLAAMCGISNRSLNRVLAELHDQHLLIVSAGTIRMVPDDI